MEAMFKLFAVKREPSCLRGIARYVWEQDKKLARGFETAEEVINTEFDKRWQEFNVGYQHQFPEHSMPPPKSINTIAAAKAPNIEEHYETFYRVYCQFTHAALRVSVGDLERFLGEDEQVIGATLIVAIEAVLDCGGTCQDLAQLRSTFFEATSSSRPQQ